MTPLAQAHRRVRRAVLGRRRLLAGVLAAIAVAAALRSTAAPPPPTVEVITAAHDLGSGVVLAADDLLTVALPAGTAATGTVNDTADLVGRTTAGPVRAGEPLTDVRLVRGSLLDGYPGLVAAPVRIGDAGAAAMLKVGDRIDILAADPQGEITDDATVVAGDVPVIAIPRADPHQTSGAGGAGGAGMGGALVVVGVPEATAQRLAGTAVTAYTSVVLKR